MISPSTGTSAPYAKVWNGASWKPVAVHLPKGMSATGSALTAVACKSATKCLVGGANIANAGSGNTRPFALTWNGTALAPAATPPLPSAATNGYLTSVTCLTLKYCVGVGTASTAHGASQPFIETWNGTAWSLKLYWHANPVTQLAFGGVSCVSPSYCMVSGGARASATASSVPYLALWNGRGGLTRSPVPVPAGSKNQIIAAVSCTSTTNCAAAGDSLTGATSAQPLGMAFTENWNGKAWTATKIAWPSATGFSMLLGISCTFANGAGRHCLATGLTGSGINSAGAAAAVTWNGSTWSLTSVPAPGAGKSSDFESVSCVSAVNCFAAGEIGPTTGPTPRPLAGFWNGSAWKLATT